MPEIPSPAATATPEPSLRIVLFGIPNAGKSSLLGALAQAAQTQAPLLDGKLLDVSAGLAALQRRLYEESPRQTIEEVVAYPVSFERSAPSWNGTKPLEALLVDCDGRAANDLLSGRKPLEGRDGSLASAVVQADVLILPVDCSSPAAQVDADFALFVQFLRLFEERRGRKTEVPGLPVFLVLTKCDLLAQQGDDAEGWIERIEERKRAVGQKFAEFLTREARAEPRPFGRVDVHLWATAVKHPPLANTPARPREPYGVAELFRQAFGSAATFKQRQERSSRRLIWTASGTAGFLALLAAMAAALIVGRTELEPSALLTSVLNYRSQEGQGASQRLREPIARKLATLREIRNDPDFEKLPRSDQEYVNDRLRELTEYSAYKERLSRVSLMEVRTEEELAPLEARLERGDLVPPREYDWAETEAGLYRARLLKDVEALRAAITEARDWYRSMTRQGEELRTFAKGRPGDAPAWAQWQKQVETLVAKPFPHTSAEQLAGDENLVYALVLQMEPVVEAARDWQAVKERLEQLRALTAALGLAGRLPNGERQPLDIPERFVVNESAPCLKRLQKLYPRLLKEAAAIDLPDAVADELRGAAARSYDHLLEAGREVVLGHLQKAGGEGMESAQAWQRVREWLAEPKELQDWRVLAGVLARIQKSEARDPVSTLTAFLGLVHFDIDVQRLTVEIPDDRKLRPAGALTVFHGSSEAPAPALVFQLAEEEGRRDVQRRFTSYTFLRKSGGAIVYGPGDGSYANVAVKREGQGGDWMLTWARSRTERYAFERLVRPPRLHLKGQENTRGELLEDVMVIPFPSSYPQVPDLLPVVKK